LAAKIALRENPAIQPGIRHNQDIFRQLVLEKPAALGGGFTRKGAKGSLKADYMVVGGVCCEPSSVACFPVIYGEISESRQSGGKTHPQAPIIAIFILELPKSPNREPIVRIREVRSQN